ncbi:putative transcription repressor PLATZ family [Helianthus debilis subsp. tardiflorus]
MASKNMKMVIFPLDLRFLLDERFFNSCLVHEEEKKNEENSFCMDCCFSLCCHCVIHHKSHRILQIRRYMYNDVLRLKEAQKIFDCSQIQVS